MRKPVHPFAQKYSASRLPQIKLTVSLVPAHKRGVSRSSRTLGRGCDGRGSVRRNFAQTNDAATDGEVVWSWRSDAGAKVVKTLPASHGRRWQPSMVTGESTKDTVKTIAQGMPAVAVCPWLLTPVLFCCTGGLGCNAHPAFPAPSFEFEGGWL